MTSHDDSAVDIDSLRAWIEQEKLHNAAEREAVKTTRAYMDANPDLVSRTQRIALDKRNAYLDGVKSALYNFERFLER